MKLRSLICVSAVAAASAAFATPIESGNVFARLKVTSDVNNSIIAIPFAGCGEDTAEIYVTNLVMTAGLDKGDTLMYKNGESWYAWEIDDNGDWVAINSGTRGGVTVTPHANEFKVACGGACWLLRSNPGAYYLYGQVTNVLQSVTVAGAASANAVAYTLIAKPSESSALNLRTWHPSGVTAGDTLLVPSATAAGGRTEYRSNGEAWCTLSTVENGTEIFGNTTYTTSWSPLSSDVVINAGCGFMYGRKGTTGFTLNW